LQHGPVVRHADEHDSTSPVVEKSRNNVAHMRSQGPTSEKRGQILSLLLEGNSLRTASRYSDTPFSTCQKLLAQVATALCAYQDCVLRNRTWEHIQIEEVWSFVYMKRSSIATAKGGDLVHGGDLAHQDLAHGDAWTWTATDDDTRFVISWLVGGRDAGYATAFVDALRVRLANRVQLARGGHLVYLEAAEGAFDRDLDHAWLVERYGAVPADEEMRFARRPMQLRRAERRNGAMRIGIRGFDSLTNSFAQKVKSHAHAVALHYMHYNFCRIHKKLRETPAIAAGVADRRWGINDFLRALEDWEATVAG
jgi:hypothetical protein